MFAPYSKRAAVTFAILIACVASVSFGHGNKSHETHHQNLETNLEKSGPVSEEQVSAALAAINQSYLQNVKVILVNSCANCHSNKTIFPWYHAIPGIKQMIERDITEARKHLDLSNDFPFTGHGSPTADLEAIQSSIYSGEMPPWSYRLMHSESGLSDEARSTVISWVQDSLALLKSSSERNSKNE
jgi:hypothetical protein